MFNSQEQITSVIFQPTLLNLAEIKFLLQLKIRLGFILQEGEMCLAL